jgi:hypothetical protein
LAGAIGGPTGGKNDTHPTLPAGWAAAPRPAGPWVVARDPLHAERTRGYAVTAEGALHRRLAQVAATPGAVLGAATRWGLLGHHDRPVTPEGERDAYAGEPVTDWYRESARLGMAVSLWDAVVADDAAGLAPFVRREGDELRLVLAWGAGRLRPEIAEQVQARPRAEWTAVRGAAGAPVTVRRVRLGRVPSGRGRSRDRAVREAVRAFVLGEVTGALHGHVRPRVEPDTGALGVEADCLRGAAWLHFATEIAAGAGIWLPRRCRGCERTFVPRRTNQTYCGAPCRSLAHYHRVTARTTRGK